MTSLIHAAGHGLVAGDAVYFGNLIPTDCGLTEGQTYYVLAEGLTANDFEVSEEDGGTAFALTFDIDSGVISKVADYAIDITPTLPEAPADLLISSQSDVTAAGHPMTFAIAQWTPSTTPHAREVVLQIIDFDPTEEDFPTWDAPFVAIINPEATEYVVTGLLADTPYAARIAVTDVFGVMSEWSTEVAFESAGTAAIVNRATRARKAKGFVSVAPSTAPTLLGHGAHAGFANETVTITGGDPNIGDLLIAQITNRAHPLGDPSVLMPDWNVLGLANTGGGWLGVFWKLAESGDTDTFSFFGMAGDRMAVFVSRWSGASGLSNSDDASGTGTAVSGGTVNSLGAGTPGMVYMGVSFDSVTSGDNLISPGASYTQLDELPSDNGFEPQSYAQYLLTSGLASSYTPTATSVNSAPWVAVVGIFKEAGHAASWDREDNIIDLNDSTYGTSAAIDLAARVALRAGRMIGRAVVRIGYSATTPRTLHIYGSTSAANSLDTATMTLLATRTLTPEGGFAQDELTFLWNPVKAYRHYVLTDESFVAKRIRTIELYEGTLNSQVAVNPITGVPMSIDDALVAVNDKIDALVLDSLADVIITAVAEGDTLRYDGAAWVNAEAGTTTIWRPVMVYDGTYWLVAVSGDGDAIMVEA